MAILSYAKCPTCPNEADTKSEVDRVFGFRNNGGNIQVQSYCKSCRTEHQKKMRQRKKRLGLL